MLEKHATASALIYHNNRVLLIHHRKKKVWIYPGGHVESYEAPDEAVIREIREECGLDIEIVSLAAQNSYAGIRTLVLPLTIVEIFLEKLQHYHLDFIYLARVKGIQTETVPIVPKQTAEADQISWFLASELDQLEMFEDAREIIVDGFATIQSFSPTP